MVRENKIPRLKAKSQDYKSVPVYAVWEVTLACNLKCKHCGSRAAKQRLNELSTAEAFDLIDQLTDIGVKEITLIGGEAYLRRDWVELINRISKHGILCTLQTGGLGLSIDKLKMAFDSGLGGIGVSIDGPPDLHNSLRGVRTSYHQAISVLDACSNHGWSSSVNTQLTNGIIEHIDSFSDSLLERNVGHWQVQLTVPMGNASDNDYLIIQPYQLLELMPILAKQYNKCKKSGMLIVPGNNIGYFGPYESLWRGPDSSVGYFSGCLAGHKTIGIEADGTIKACPSLSKLRYGGGNIRTNGLENIWDYSEGLQINRPGAVESLWGYCKVCYYADVCRGGCTWMADSLFGKKGNNPYCHYRALELEKKGEGEIVTKVVEASTESFGTGLYKLERIKLDSITKTNRIPTKSI